MTCKIFTSKFLTFNCNAFTTAVVQTADRQKQWAIKAIPKKQFDPRLSKCGFITFRTKYCDEYKNFTKHPSHVLAPYYLAHEKNPGTPHHA